MLKFVGKSLRKNRTFALVFKYLPQEIHYHKGEIFNFIVKNPAETSITKVNIPQNKTSSIPWYNSLRKKHHFSGILENKYITPISLLEPHKHKWRNNLKIKKKKSPVHFKSVKVMKARGRLNNSQFTMEMTKETWCLEQKNGILVQKNDISPLIS